MNESAYVMPRASAMRDHATGQRLLTTVGAYRETAARSPLSASAIPSQDLLLTD